MLHRPEINKTNPKICRQWEGPYLVVSLPNETNALIQDLKSGKSRFVHKNRIKPFLGPLSLSRNSNKNASLENADTPHLQDASTGVQNSDTGPQKFIRIESEDVVVLNPDDPVPLPIPVKVEEKSSDDDKIIIKEEVVSPTLSPVKFLTQKVQKLKENFHIPSTSEVGDSLLPPPLRGDSARSSSSRTTRTKAQREGIQIDNLPLPPRPIEHQKRKSKK